jgi:anthranilate/para-aminobenzoate synthase component II
MELSFPPVLVVRSMRAYLLGINRQISLHLPILGVCLGHQSIGQVFGGMWSEPVLMHGKTSPIYHNSEGVFQGLENPLLPPVTIV